MYYLTTWHAGSTLQQLLDAGIHFTVPEAIAHGTQLVRAIGALHRRSIIHRDIKPANTHVGDDKQLRVLDMGGRAIRTESRERERHAAGGDGRHAVLSRAGTIRSKGGVAPDRFVRCRRHAVLPADPALPVWRD
ncbi:hypothetical protein ACFS07_06955 [Undibacterium arcticum]